MIDYKNHPVFVSGNIAQLPLTAEEIGFVRALRARRDDAMHPATVICADSGKSADYPALAARIYNARRDRDAIFEAGLFADPAWDLLLYIYACTQRGDSVSVSAACHAAGVPESTALRYLAALTEKGYLTSTAHLHDRRCSKLEMSPRGSELMTRWLSELDGV
ncbi:MAG: hypothetical protein JWO15_953 [Sphingomonadales bacterium]|nr:hypothetical protein [Sphingomonadales bacterium]